MPGMGVHDDRNTHAVWVFERTPHRYVDLEHDPVAGAELRWWSGGRMSHPTVSIGGVLLVEPTLKELDWALAEAGPV